MFKVNKLRGENDKKNMKLKHITNHDMQSVCPRMSPALVFMNVLIFVKQTLN